MSTHTVFLGAAEIENGRIHVQRSQLTRQKKHTCFHSLIINTHIHRSKWSSGGQRVKPCTFSSPFRTRIIHVLCSFYTAPPCRTPASSHTPKFRCVRCIGKSRLSASVNGCLSCCLSMRSCGEVATCPGCLPVCALYDSWERLQQTSATLRAAERRVYKMDGWIKLERCNTEGRQRTSLTLRVELTTSQNMEGMMKSGRAVNGLLKKNVPSQELAFQVSSLCSLTACLTYSRLISG